MRVSTCAGLVVAAMLLASIASAQGLGDVAAREKSKRKSAPETKPAKVYTETDLGPASSTPSAVATTDTAAGTTANPAGGEAKPGQKAEDPDKAAAEAAAKAQEEWRNKIGQARTEESNYLATMVRLQALLNDTSAMYSPGWTAAMAQMDDVKQKLAAVREQIAALEAEGRQAGYQ
jgi:hypothetical protein